MSPQQLVDRGQAIYDRMYRGEYESRYVGQFAVVDVGSEAAYVAKSADAALAAARQANPSGQFLLIRIGAPGAFRVSHTTHADRPRILPRGLSCVND